MKCATFGSNSGLPLWYDLVKQMQTWPLNACVEFAVFVNFASFQFLFEKYKKLHSFLYFSNKKWFIEKGEI